MATYDVNALLSATAYGSDGDKIGKVEQVFLDDNTEEVISDDFPAGLVRPHEFDNGDDTTIYIWLRPSSFVWYDVCVELGKI